MRDRGELTPSDRRLRASPLEIEVAFSAFLVIMLLEVTPRKKATSPCLVARTLDIVGDRWTILILRDLLTHESRRLQELETSIRGVSPNTLSTRLKSREEHPIVTRRMYEEHPLRAEYLFTPKGRELGPALCALQL